MSNEIRVYKYLDKLEIQYEITNHKPLYTMEDVKEVSLPGIELKNLVLKDKKKEKYYFVVLVGETRLDIKEFRNITGASSKVTFVSAEELALLLDITPGACSPFNLLNDKEGIIDFVFLREVLDIADYEIVNFHPNINTATVSLKFGDFKRFLRSINNQKIYP